ncbi:MAG: homoserine kinase, partial [Anaerolineales bacterium]
MKSATVLVPATAANLGPGFDCLALALAASLEVTLSLEGQGLEVEIDGEGTDSLPRGDDNLIVRAARLLFGEAELAAPGLRLRCSNAIPIASGLGSSAAAVIAGLTAANAILEDRFSLEEILNHAAGIEGHADNAAAALLGGLTVV